MTVDILNNIIAATLRNSTPLMLAALGGVFCQKAKVFNIGLEGIMLIGAFSAICGVMLSGGSAYVGLIFAVLCGIVFSLLFGFVDAVGIKLELSRAAIPSSIIKMFPYILTVAALAVSCFMRQWKENHVSQKQK